MLLEGDKLYKPYQQTEFLFYETLKKRRDIAPFFPSYIHTYILILRVILIIFFCLVNIMEGKESKIKQLVPLFVLL